ncbi:methylated-DNA-[protein]-cysteine S-methyltransferase [Terribacillus aidingensis]|uniref:methylated-DNA--[protein]-cysteine S-methyltransferase n=1 Tax=Terribacillus aidingensis TaxID=586416 RepID=A0A285N4I0_9BACI|nr:methylated-DNA--[protein]-cysteine S-methyltransferase [Terribacillus aidingensis]SNZ04238.1 methylated-DNA-[protein]-cysteine S-methyltransferase [Terribacillus aidingensis]
MSYTDNVKTPVGNIQITATDQAITSIAFGEELPVCTNELTQLAQTQLHAYFSGNSTSFQLPLAVSGTLFQQRIWEQVNQIPYGSASNYSAVAESSGNVRAVRAAANAIGRNTFAIVVPCHRVIGRNGSLTGYRWEAWRKEWLLKFEQQRSR